MKADDTTAIKLALATFAILVLELAMIRWLATQVRIAAYFANLVLVAAFLGMGLGVGLARTRPGLARWTIPVLAVVSILLAAATPLGLTHLTFPDPAISLWGAETAGTWFQFVRSALVVLACFWGMASVFVFLGTQVGLLFEPLPPLKAYSADLAGSFAGVLAMAAVAALWAPPSRVDRARRAADPVDPARPVERRRGGGGHRGRGLFGFRRALLAV